MAISREKFENKCMDVITQIVASDRTLDRQGAILVSEKLLEKAKASGKKLTIDVYTRVLNEFKIATDKEYEELKKQIFD